MILGTGVDIVSIERIAIVYDKFKERFVNKILSQQEQKLFIELADSKKITYLASRWAAKEAVAKAIGIGMTQGLYPKLITILNNKKGKPEVYFSHTAQQVVHSVLNQQNSQYIFHLSISHEIEHAIAFVIFECN